MAREPVISNPVLTSPPPKHLDLSRPPPSQVESPPPLPPIPPHPSSSDDAQLPSSVVLSPTLSSSSVLSPTSQIEQGQCPFCLWNYMITINKSMRNIELSNICICIECLQNVVCVECQLVLTTLQYIQTSFIRRLQHSQHATFHTHSAETVQHGSRDRMVLLWFSEAVYGDGLPCLLQGVVQVTPGLLCNIPYISGSMHKNLMYLNIYHSADTNPTSVLADYILCYLIPKCPHLKTSCGPSMQFVYKPVP